MTIGNSRRIPNGNDKDPTLNDSRETISSDDLIKVNDVDELVSSLMCEEPETRSKIISEIKQKLADDTYVIDSLKLSKIIILQALMDRF